MYKSVRTINSNTFGDRNSKLPPQILYLSMCSFQASIFPQYLSVSAVTNDNDYRIYVNSLSTCLHWETTKTKKKKSGESYRYRVLAGVLAGGWGGGG